MPARRGWELLTRYGFPAESIPHAIDRGKSHTLFAEVVGRDLLVLDFEVDTNHPQFLIESEQTNGQPLIKQIEVQVVSRTESGKPRDDAGVLYVHLTPAKRMERFEGYVAHRLGQHQQHDGLPRRLLSGRRPRRDGSQAGKERRRPSHPLGASYQEIRPSLYTQQYGLGRLQHRRPSTRGPTRLAHPGAKRLLADMNVATKQEILVGNHKHSISKELPAELFLCGMFRGFHERQLRVPRRIAITCPATFSDWETRRLREAVVQGWRRSLGADTRSYDPKKIRDPDLPDIVLDEASAAAFYFLYHDYIDETGGLDVLNYLHGGHGGLNLLVFDCGGGTTDIGLIHAAAQYKKSKEEKRLGRLSIEVLGRTGHRTFGGDDITVAAFRAIKAKIAKVLGWSKGILTCPPKPPTYPLSSTELRPRSMRLSQQCTIQIISGSRKTRRKRRPQQLSLWRLAELYKIALGSKQESPVKIEPGVRGTVIADQLPERDT